MEGKKEHQTTEPTFKPIGEIIYTIVYFMHGNPQTELSCQDRQTGASYKLALNPDGNLTYKVPVSDNSPYFHGYIVEPNCQLLFDTKQLTKVAPEETSINDPNDYKIINIARGFNDIVDGLAPSTPDKKPPTTIQLELTAPAPETLSPEQKVIKDKIIDALMNPGTLINKPGWGKTGQGKSRIIPSQNNPDNDFNF